MIEFMIGIVVGVNLVWLALALCHAAGRDCDDEETMAMAGELYTAYAKAVGGKAFNGDPLPTWEEFSNDPAKQVQVRGWIAVANH